ncbi:MAG: TonB family protein [Verrucomicrobia bacterium]|nr:TonB family protein [Verrucomicrobiota bacterium]
MRTLPEMKISLSRLISIFYPLIMLGALALVRLAAQDVTVGEPVWFSPEAAPDKLPEITSKQNLEYPQELEKAEVLGYVIAQHYIDAAGTTSGLGTDGTNQRFQSTIEAQQWEMTPAKRLGQPVPARIFIPAIFNPKSASVKGPSATPRLLSVAPALTSERAAASGGSLMVPMRLNLDATGAITQATPEDPKVNEKVLSAVQEALKKWRFAPARANGQAVATELVVPVICLPSIATLGKLIPPKATNTAAPLYPRTMRRYGLNGTVRLRFVINAEGQVINPVVVRSSNPALEESAITTVLQWRFRPGRVDAKPVKTQAEISIVFRVKGSEEPFALTIEKDQSKLPPEFRYDTPAKLLGVLLPVYPYALRQAGVTGSAKAVVTINTRGQVASVKLISADRPEFGLALTAALEGFAFEPALKNGNPVPQLVNFEQQFDSTELPDKAGDALLEFEKKPEGKIATASMLDHPLKVLSQRRPHFPLALTQPGAKGEALIEILVDQNGHARLPRIVSASADAFGYAAAQAAATWYFKPPLAGGKPAIVRVRVPVEFSTRLTPDPTPVASGSE